jgi:hypothetical protein
MGVSVGGDSRVGRGRAQRRKLLRHGTEFR